MPLLTALLALAAVAQPIASAPHVIDDATRRTVVVSAFGPELDVLKARLTDAHDEVLAGDTYHVGRIGGHDVVLFLSGVSMVNAAMTTQAAIDHFHVERIIFTGIAGGTDDRLRIGDVVIPERWSEYLESVFARKTGHGYAVPAWLGKTKPNYGMIFPYRTEVMHPGGQPPEKRFWFDADGGLIALARRVAAEPASPPARAASVGGNGVSGPAFVDNARFRDWLARVFSARVVDNESAAVAHVAYANHLPFLVVRGISDYAGSGAGQNQENANEKLASDHAGRFTLRLIEALP